MPAADSGQGLENLGWYGRATQFVMGLSGVRQNPYVPSPTVAPGTSLQGAGPGVDRPGPRSGALAAVPTGPTYPGQDGKTYPVPPADWTGTLAEWERLSRYMATSTGRVYKGPNPPRTPPKPPPPAQPSTPPINPNAPIPGTPSLDPFGTIFTVQWLWEHRADLIAAAQRNPKWFKQPKKRKKTKPAPLDPNIMRRSLPLEVPVITAKRLPMPKRAPAPRPPPVDLTVPVIFQTRLPTPTPRSPASTSPTRSSSTVPKSSVLSRIDPLTAAFLLSRPGAATVKGPKITYQRDPLTVPQSGAVASPSPFYAGSARPTKTDQCNCPKPRKRNASSCTNPITSKRHTTRGGVKFQTITRKLTCPASSRKKHP
jgi:hypothetical protein